MQRVKRRTIAILLGLLGPLTLSSPVLSSTAPLHCGDELKSCWETPTQESPKVASLDAETFARLPLQRQITMFAELPVHQQVKIWLTGILGLTTDAIHIYIGFFCLLATILLLNKSAGDFAVLIPGFVVSFGMEAFDLVHDVNHLGFFRWLASAHDIVNTNLIPVLLVMFFRLWMHVHADPTVHISNKD